MFGRKKRATGDIPPVAEPLASAPIPDDVPPEELSKANIQKVTVEVSEEQQMLNLTAYVFTISARWVDWRAAEGSAPFDAPPRIIRSSEDFNWLRTALMARFPGAIVPPLSETTGFGNEYIETSCRLNELTEIMDQFFEAVIQHEELGDALELKAFVLIDSKDWRALFGMGAINVDSALASGEDFDKAFSTITVAIGKEFEKGTDSLSSTLTVRDFTADEVGLDMAPPQALRLFFTDAAAQLEMICDCISAQVRSAYLSLAELERRDKLSDPALLKNDATPQELRGVTEALSGGIASAGQLLTRISSKQIMVDHAGGLGDLHQLGLGNSPFDSPRMGIVLAEEAEARLESRRIQLIALHQECRKLIRWIAAVLDALDGLDATARLKVLAIRQREKAEASLATRINMEAAAEDTDREEGTVDSAADNARDGDEGGNSRSSGLFGNAIGYMYGFAAATQTTEQERDQSIEKERTATQHAFEVYTRTMTEAEAACEVMKEAVRLVVVRWLEFERAEAQAKAEALTKAITSASAGGRAEGGGGGGSLLSILSSPYTPAGGAEGGDGA
mmetsp:Transcript_69170/g.193343  ORF Transcript_69170/g.193343 Transcript_69170/m.193343 type:complete len:563 (-) Transcript_69170:636-2324(-)